MENDESAATTRSDKSSSPVSGQPANHPYPDWASIQAYYGPGVPFPPPYFSATGAPGPVPHPYMWNPQPLVPPYGTPYTAIYPHGGVYSHPSMALMATPLSIESPAKSASNKDSGLMTKLKGFNELVVSSNDNTNNTRNKMNGTSQSDDNGAEGSSAGSDGNSGSGGEGMHRKRGSDEKLTSGNGKVGTTMDTIGVVGKSPSSATPSGVVVPSMVSSGPISGMEYRLSRTTKASVTPVLPPNGAKDERAFKREKRKQSNRESARRSRLRKQAETEEFSLKVETLMVENTNLRSEISQLKENSAKLRLENSQLTEKLKDARLRD